MNEPTITLKPSRKRALARLRGLRRKDAVSGATQERDENGRFVGSTSLGEDVLGHVGQFGGDTIAVYSGSHPTVGYAVSTTKGAELIVPRDKFDKATVVAYVENHAIALAQPGAKLGVWVDGDNVYLDLSQVVPTIEEAQRLGRENGQEAVYDFSTGQSIRLKEGTQAAQVGGRSIWGRSGYPGADRGARDARQSKYASLLARIRKDAVSGATQARDENGRFSAGGDGGKRAAEDDPTTWQWAESQRQQAFAKYGDRLVEHIDGHWARTFAGCDEIQSAADAVLADPKGSVARWQQSGQREQEERSSLMEKGAVVLIDRVNNGTEGTYFRGMRGIQMDDFKVGQVVDIPVASATTNEGSAAGYATYDYGERFIVNGDATPIEDRGRVILELHGKGTPQVAFESMKEVLVSGRYRVVELKPAGTYTDRGTIDQHGSLIPGSQRTFEKIEEPRRVVLEQIGQFDVPVVTRSELDADAALWKAARWRQ